MDDLKALTQEIVSFRDERDWEQFHTLKHLATALSIEVSELQELFLWKDREEVAQLLETEEKLGALRQEVADILIYALLFCHRAGVDPVEAIRAKLKHNAEKYPVEKSRGKATKYTDID